MREIAAQICYTGAWQLREGGDPVRDDQGSTGGLESTSGSTRGFWSIASN
jgi:hypothetical protein